MCSTRCPAGCGTECSRSTGTLRMLHETHYGMSHRMPMKLLISRHRMLHKMHHGFKMLNQMHHGIGHSIYLLAHVHDAPDAQWVQDAWAGVAHYLWVQGAPRIVAQDAHDV